MQPIAPIAFVTRASVCCRTCGEMVVSTWRSDGDIAPAAAKKMHQWRDLHAGHDLEEMMPSLYEPVSEGAAPLPGKTSYTEFPFGD